MSEFALAHTVGGGVEQSYRRNVQVVLDPAGADGGVGRLMRRQDPDDAEGSMKPNLGTMVVIAVDGEITELHYRHRRRREFL